VHPVVLQVSDPALAANLEAAAAAIYALLQPALSDPARADAVLHGLATSAAVWVGCGFVEGRRCALSAPDGVAQRLPAAAQPEQAAQPSRDEEAQAVDASEGGRRSSDDSTSGSGAADAGEWEEADSSDLWPLLCFVPAQLAQVHAEVLTAAGVAPSFGVAAYAAGLRQLAAQAGQGQLGGSDLRLALRLVKLAEAAAAAAALQVTAGRWVASCCMCMQLWRWPDQPCPLPGACAAAASMVLASCPPPPPRSLQATPSSHGDLDAWLPDESGVMVPAAQLHYNDASWLLDAQRQEGTAAGLRLVHPEVSSAAAELLGARSVRWVPSVDRTPRLAPWPALAAAICVWEVVHALPGACMLPAWVCCTAVLAVTTAAPLCLGLCRRQHESSGQVTSALPCAAPRALRFALTQQGLLPPFEPPSTDAAAAATNAAAAARRSIADRALLTVMLDVLEVADAAGSEQASIILDCRQHGTQSLLHAGLAQTQGEAGQHGAGPCGQATLPSCHPSP
jgi:hypothetical protein